MTVANREKLQEDVSFNRFCKIVLGWDHVTLLKEADKKNKSDNGKTDIGLTAVKNTYKDVDDYLSTFEPLLFEEVKANITQNKDDGEVTDWEMRLVTECNEVEGFFQVAVTYGDTEENKISQNDLLLLCKEKANWTAYAYALVEHTQHTCLRLRMFLAGEIKNTRLGVVESSPRLLNMQSHITAPVKPQEKPLFSLKICSLSTISREYLGLRSIGSLPFKDLILKATDRTGSEDQAWKVSEALRGHFEGTLNPSQIQAVNAGLSRKPFVLIQGPPGTGKTQTILALLSAILHATPARVHLKAGSREIKCGSQLSVQDKYNHWTRASPWLTGINPRDEIMPKGGDAGFFPTTGSELKPEIVASSRRYRLRVLVCAPSNSALDEIVLRLLRNGVLDETVSTYNPKIVRIGLKAHHSVQSVCMDYLVRQKQNESGIQKHGATGGDADNIRSSILDEAVIVFSTLSFSGSALFSKLNHGFDVVIIDEAAQAINCLLEQVEPATLVPLSNGCKQVFLVGDPVQLPATVISSNASKLGYCTSLFERFQRAGYPVNMLKMQYRMHPEIRNFPSSEFYSEALEDATDIEEKTRRSWHKYRCFSPFCFFDLHESQESQPSGSGSYVNTDEVEFVILLYRKLVSMHPELGSSSQFAIISPYRYQVKLLQDKFKENFGQDSREFVDIQTVDGFQGREKDVAIFSCVRASESKGIGFVSDARRMNVGITRAKSTVLVVGSATTLKRDKHWTNLIESAEKRNVLFKVSKPYASFLSDSNLEGMTVKKDDMDDGMIEEDHDLDFGVVGNANQLQGDDDVDDVDDDDGGDVGMDDD
ncbi:Probable helicase MAGATAMA 3 [Linum perenne]